MGKQRRILIASDNQTSLSSLAKATESLGYGAELARRGAEVLAKLGDVDLVVVGAMLADMAGIEAVKRIRSAASHSEVPIIMMAGPEGQVDRLQALEAGANLVLSGPEDGAELQLYATSLVKAKQVQDDVAHQRASLEAELEQKGQELGAAVERAAAAEEKAQHAQAESVQRLGLAAEYKSDETGGHVQRVRAYCALIAGALDLPKKEIELASIGSTMHDIGKIGVPDAVLLKESELTPEEWQTVKQHTVIGARILSDSSLDLFRTGEAIALAHHEQWDGGGYPKGLSGTNIPPCGRICKIADVFDAVTRNRPYRRAVSHEKALEIMANGRGKHFDPEILDVFLANSHHLIGIQRKYPDGVAATS